MTAVDSLEAINGFAGQGRGCIRTSLLHLPGPAFEVARSLQSWALPPRRPVTTTGLAVAEPVAT